MKGSKLESLLKLNLTLIIINIAIFSPGLIGLSFDTENPIKAAMATVILFISVIIFGMGNFNILTEEEQNIDINKLNTSETYKKALKANLDKKTFVKDIRIILDQIERLNRKKEIIQEILLQKFNSTELSYTKFELVVNDTEKLFYVNVKSVINKLNIFDDSDYRNTKREMRNRINTRNKIYKEKIQIYSEYIMFVKGSIENNEEILLRLDKLILELSKFNSLEEGELENTQAMKEIDELTKKTNLYR